MIRLGVVGHGGRISSFIKNRVRTSARQEVRVVAIVDPDEPGARSRLAPEDSDARFYDSVDQMMRATELDGVLVGTRCNLHAPYGAELAGYDVPVFLEKPVAISYEQAEELERAYENSSCPVLVSFPLRVSPLHNVTKQTIRNGAVGRIEHILAFNYVPYGTVYWHRPYRDYSITGGLFLQKATHDFDYMMDLLDCPIVRVAAAAHYGGVFGGDKPADLSCSVCDEYHSCPESPLNRVRNGSGGAADHMCVFSEACGNTDTGTNEDASSALLEFASGAHGVYTQVFLTRRDAAKRGATISGYQGTIDFDWYKSTLVKVRHHEPFTDTIRTDDDMSHFGGDTELALNFIGIIEGRESSRADIRAGLRSIYACLAARESSLENRFIDVRQV